MCAGTWNIEINLLENNIMPFYFDCCADKPVVNTGLITIVQNDNVNKIY